MSRISTHILDISRGKPAGGARVILEMKDQDGDWFEIGRGVTDTDGRVPNLLAPVPKRIEDGKYAILGTRDSLTDGLPLFKTDYRLTFDTGAYYAAMGVDGFYPHVVIAFTVRDTTTHYHVPLLLSPYGYSTYRGS